MLLRLTDISPRAPALDALTEIFFLSSSRVAFDSTDDRVRFLTRWTQFYIDHHPEDVWFWRDDDGQYAGYLTGCRNSVQATSLASAIASYTVFDDQFRDFPAHLHVNCRPDRRGVGVGAQLVERFVQDCCAESLSGVHVVTGVSARNVSFYARLGFNHRLTRHWVSHPLLFMGRRLTAPQCS
ncbi:GCN5 family acetyltransferase [Azospirillaceae bacterium]